MMKLRFPRLRCGGGTAVVMVLVATSTGLTACGASRTLPSPMTTATRVYGQPNFTTSTLNTGGLSATSLWNPGSAAVAGAGGLYIADSRNNRVLHYPGHSTTADRVYGQPDFTTNTVNTGGLSATSLYYPEGLAVDGAGGLYVADFDNNRVVHYPAGSITADRVYGQPDFASRTDNTGGVSATSLAGPQGVAVDSTGGLYVADYGNSRVLHYPAGSTTADRAYGQPDFTTNSGHFNLTGGVSATTMSFPDGVAVDGAGGLYVADYENSRVLRYPAGSTTADRVYGQPDFTSRTINTGGVSATSLYFPDGVAVDGTGGLYVADDWNNRVLFFPRR